MPLTVCTDLTPAAWLVTSTRDPWRLVTMGPGGFAAHARLRFIPDPGWVGQSENDVEVGPDHPSDQAQLAAALDVLVRHTGTPDDCYFAVWEGWPVDPVWPVFELPHRAYWLVHGSLGDFSAWPEMAMWPPPKSHFPPAFVWPADRAWCVANDVDPHYAGIGADPAAIDDLLADSTLDVVPADPDQDQPAYR